MRSRRRASRRDRDAGLATPRKELVRETSAGVPSRLSASSRFEFKDLFDRDDVDDDAPLASASANAKRGAGRFSTRLLIDWRTSDCMSAPPASTAAILSDVLRMPRELTLRIELLEPRNDAFRVLSSRPVAFWLSAVSVEIDAFEIRKEPSVVLLCDNTRCVVDGDGRGGRSLEPGLIALGAKTAGESDDGCVL